MIRSRNRLRAVFATTCPNTWDHWYWHLRLQHSDDGCAIRTTGKKGPLGVQIAGGGIDQFFGFVWQLATPVLPKKEGCPSI
jgi:hypothetical protein